MEITRKNGEVVFPNFIPESGVVFFICSWSQSILYLNYLVSILDNYPTIPLFVIDIDSDLYLSFKNKYQIHSHGLGETFWLFEGKVVSKVIDYKLERDMVEHNTIELLNA